MKEVRVKHFEMWNMSASMIFGKSPKCTMMCGSCSIIFKKRFSPMDFKNKYPKALCPSCNTVNEIPITIQ